MPGEINQRGFALSSGCSVFQTAKVLFVQWSLLVVYDLRLILTTAELNTLYDQRNPCCGLILQMLKSLKCQRLLQLCFKGSYLQSLHHLPDVFSTVVMGRHHDTLPTLIEELNTHNPWGPSNDVSARAVEHHIFWIFLYEHNKFVGNAEQAIYIQRLAKVPGTDAPSDRSHAEQMCILPRFHLLFLLGPEGDKTKLDCIVNSSSADKVLSQVFQVFLPCTSRHSSELLWLVCGIFSVDDFGKQEVPENCWLWESYRLGNWGPERRHVFRSGNGHAVKQDGMNKSHVVVALQRN